MKDNKQWSWRWGALPTKSLVNQKSKDILKLNGSLKEEPLEISTIATTTTITTTKINKNENNIPFTYKEKVEKYLASSAEALSQSPQQQKYLSSIQTSSSSSKSTTSNMNNSPKNYSAVQSSPVSAPVSANLPEQISTTDPVSPISAPAQIIATPTPDSTTFTTPPLHPLTTISNPEIYNSSHQNPIATTTTHQFNESPSSANHFSLYEYFNRRHSIVEILKHIEISISNCRFNDLLKLSDEAANELFEKNIITYDYFCENPTIISKNDDIVCKINKR